MCSHLKICKAKADVRLPIDWEWVWTVVNFAAFLGLAYLVLIGRSQ